MLDYRSIIDELPQPVNPSYRRTASYGLHKPDVTENRHLPNATVRHGFLRHLATGECVEWPHAVATQRGLQRHHKPRRAAYHGGFISERNCRDGLGCVIDVAARRQCVERQMLAQGLLCRPA